MDKNSFVNLYTDFRKELDKMAIPLIYDEMRIIKPIIADGKTVGIICGAVDYIDCVYVMPEYRRKGLAKKAVKDYVKGILHYGIRLHIIDNNETALKFWNSIFELKEIGSNGVDTLYEIARMKK
jgi:ribosomal protein S18 acetylase RimI-like enzyme